MEEQLNTTPAPGPAPLVDPVAQAKALRAKARAKVAAEPLSHPAPEAAPLTKPSAKPSKAPAKSAAKSTPAEKKPRAKKEYDYEYNNVLFVLREPSGKKTGYFFGWNDLHPLPAGVKLTDDSFVVQSSKSGKTCLIKIVKRVEENLGGARGNIGPLKRYWNQIAKKFYAGQPDAPAKPAKAKKSKPAATAAEPVAA